MTYEPVRKFGWIPSDPDHQLTNQNYHLDKLGLSVPPMGSVEVALPRPSGPGWITNYDQDGYGACVGASCSRAGTSANMPEDGVVWFNWLELYYQAQREAGQKPDPDSGAQLWAAGNVMKNMGFPLKGSKTFNNHYCIDHYYWAKNVDGLRTALYNGYQVVFGVPWHINWMAPQSSDGKLWIALGSISSWGGIAGGHAIVCLDASDSAHCSIGTGYDGAFAFSNTWGNEYPEKVWLPYSCISKLMSESSEIMVVVDKEVEPPPPPPPVEDTLKIKLTDQAGKKYVGVLKEQQ